jgi:IMP dehydrogenase
MVAYKGPVEDVVYQVSAGSAPPWGTAARPSIVDLQREARFVTITQASLLEGHPHDVTITKDAPNYSVRR